MSQQPEPYVDAIKELNDVYKANVKFGMGTIDSDLHRIKNTHDAHNKMADALSSATIEYMQAGYANLHTRRPNIDLHIHGTGWGNYGFTWQRYFKDLAKDMKRPFVLIGHRSNYDYYDRCYKQWNFIRMPKRNYVQPLLTMFHILPESVCKVETNTVTHEVQFLTNETNIAEELLQVWQGNCLTEPTYRKALRLDV